MITFIVALLISAAILFAFWYWRDTLRGWRTILFNGLSAAGVTTGLMQVGDFLAGFDWAGLLGSNKTQLALLIVLVITLVNMGLRFMTKTLWGEK